MTVSRVYRLSRCPRGETARHFETGRDSGTVQMSHSSVTGVRSKSLIRLWISGKYSLENHFSSRTSLPSLSCTFRGVPGMSSSSFLGSSSIGSGGRRCRCGLYVVLLWRIVGGCR